MITLTKVLLRGGNLQELGQTDKESDMVHPTSIFPAVTIQEIKNNCVVTKDDCWEWQGRRQKNYGQLSFKGKSFAVHRISCFLQHGEPNEGDFALHSCDNPPCVNPNHLRWGTQLENMKDCRIRNRKAIKRGERNGRSKIDSKKVLAIRAIAGTGPTNNEIAELYGISNQLVSRIIKGEAWSHVS